MVRYVYKQLAIAILTGSYAYAYLHVFSYVYIAKHYTFSYKWSELLI